MTTQHLFNEPQSLVLDSLRSSTLLNPSLGHSREYKSIYRKHTLPGSNRKVTVIAGGGAGHEPAYGGYVGAGMLDGGVSGEIFASPSARQIEMCARLALSNEDQGEGGERERERERELLVIINNYTGDILNFGLAIERIKSPDWMARGSAVRVESVVVADDVSVGRAQGGKVGRRGLAGNILVCKILGAGAEKGLNIAQLKCLGDATVANLASIGLSLDHCHVPGRTVNHSDSLPPRASSLGMGLHNEPGVRILDPTPNPERTIKEMLDLIFDTGPDRNFVTFNPDDRVVLFINNLGGMSILEMGGIVTEAVKQLEDDRGIHPERVLCSSYMTSLNGPGFSITLLNVGKAEEQYMSAESAVDIVELIDLPTDAAAWQGSKANNWKSKGQERSPSDSIPAQRGRPDETSNTTIRVTQSSLQAIKRACKRVMNAEAAMTRYDTIVGDGDCGATWAKGAEGILQAIDAGSLNTTSNANMVESLARIVEDKMGGTSGALFALFLTGLSRALSSTDDSIQDSTTHNPWGRAAQSALDTLSNYTPAKLGDRTLVDALAPFVTALQRTGLEEAVEACRIGVENTKDMKPKLGRSVYVGGEGEPWRGVPDPGAWGVLAVVCGLAGVEMPPAS